MKSATLAYVLLLCCVPVAHATSAGVKGSANPIRRVVNMLQQMSKKVEAEGKKEEELFEKFMCYCKTGVGDLEREIAAAEAKIPKVEAALKESIALLDQLKAEIKEHKADLAAAEADVAEAKGMREKESKDYAKRSTDYSANIVAMGKAIEAIEKGMGKSFLQTKQASLIRRLTIEMDMNAMDRDVVASFLTQKTDEGYAPQSGQIVGILKQMKDTMEADLKDLIATEEAAIKDFTALMAAKTKEIKANQKALESKLEREGEVGVEIEEQKEDLDDTKKSLAEDKKFLAELQKSCGSKEAEWEERCKMRAAELLAIADTIKILNDDDALELFKKTLPAPTLLQLQVSSKEMARRAMKVLSHRSKGDPRIRFISLALRGKTGGFEKVLKMIDSMVVLLGKEQKDDDEKKAWCEKELDVTEDELKELEETAKDLKAAMEEAEGSIKTLTEEIADLNDGIAKLDEQVKEATATRKAENAEYKDRMASDTATREILLMAQNRLAKFYTPKLYKPPAKKELSEAGAIERNFGAASFVEVRMHRGSEQIEDAGAPPPPPETWGAYQKKGEESAGVMQMMQLLLTDLEKDMTEAKTEETEAQKEYEELIAESAAKRKEDTNSIKDKTAAKADMTARLEKLTLEHKATIKEAYAKTETLGDLHRECDWLLSNFDNRKAARAGEVDSLNKAKAVLSGADYSLAQLGATHSRLRGNFA